MKSMIVIMLSFILFACAPFTRVSISTDYGYTPQWGPAGYENARYYYLPDIEAYYDIQNSVFIYYYESNWVRRSYLPVQYRNYDLYKGYKVVMTDYKGDSPYTSFNEYRQKYQKGFRGNEQRNIGVRTVNTDSKRRVNKADRTERKVINNEENSEPKVIERSTEGNSDSNRNDIKTPNDDKNNNDRNSKKENKKNANNTRR